MILTYEQLAQHQQQVAMVDGCFDPIHIGHVKYFEVAAELGMPLLCNVQSDSYIRENKKRPNLLPEEQRVTIIDNMQSIAYVHLCRTSTHDVLANLRPLKYIKGMDWQHRQLPEIEREICEKLGIEIVYLDTNLDTSTNIVSSFSRLEHQKMVEQFAQLVFAQKEVAAKHYDDMYFMGDWREGDNDYSVDRRRVIEAKNPINIKKVFRPQRILDVGCGPGALMYLLYELGIDSYGLDFSKEARELAPQEVKDKIAVAPITQFHKFPVQFDLVICREVLEHLTILQISQAVRNLAAYTKKYLYVTTRFHPAPTQLLDITDDFITDPTHITLLNKEFLKLLFVLQGMKPRPDLEAQMDWKNLGRVLVFEKV